MSKTVGHQQRIVGDFPDVNGTSEKLRIAYQELYKRTGVSGEMTDWLDWPAEYLGSREYSHLKETAEWIQQNNSAVIVIGIGGSYLTPQMILHSKYGDSYNETAEAKGLPRIYFAGCDLSPDRLWRILDLIKNDEFSIIYVSKSGGTIEPAFAFRIFWDKLYKKYGEEANAHVYAITDAERGTLNGMARKNIWESFVIPDGIGGRYSGLTAVGLLPVAIAGIDTDAILQGAIEAMADCKDNPQSFAGQYAEWRYTQYMPERRSVEFFAMNTPDMAYFGEWLKQLFGESDGKDRRGLFPASGVFPTDLHSLGQFLQEGTRGLIAETFFIREFENDILLPESNLQDNLVPYTGTKYSDAADAAMTGAFNAHTQGGNTCATIRFGSTLQDLGYLMQSMFVACAVNAYMLGVNPFNQPGVELHKTEMRAALGSKAN